jgi:nucleoside-diphosphate-sugar epimerase
MKIVLTGSTGFIGAALREKLVAAGHEVFGLHATPRLQPAATDPYDRIVDISDWTSVLRFAAEIGSCDAIIHTAASLDMTLTAPNVSAVNCTGTQNMIRLRHETGATRFLFMSSLPVIGRPRDLPVTETHPTSPETAYHASKLFGEQLVRLDGAQNSDIAAASLRLTAPIGPGMPRNRLLTVLIDRALKNDPIELLGKGGRRQNYIDVRDIVAATETLLGGRETGIYNIAAPCAISNVELVQLCIDRCNSSSSIVFKGEDKQEDMDWNVSTQRAHQDFGFAANIGIEASIDALKTEMMAS